MGEQSFLEWVISITNKPDGETLGRGEFIALMTAFAVKIQNDQPSSAVFTKVISAAGSTITDTRLVGKNVAAYILNDITKNTGFSKPQSSDTLTLSDGTTVGVGNVVTILLY